MQWLAQLCVKRPVFATVLVLSIVVVGIFSYFRLNVDRFPKVDFNLVTITVRLDGASPEEIETDVVDKIEQAVNSVSGIDTLNSVSFEGVGFVSVVFDLEKDINIALQEVRDKVNSVLPELPTDIKAPVVDKVDPDASPIIELALTSSGSIRDTTEFADKVLRRNLESIQGVGEVRILGGTKRQINIILDAGRMRSLNVTTTDIQRALVTQNIQIPGGEVDQNARSLTLRTQGRVKTPQEFADIVVAKRGNTFLRISDLARIEDSQEEAKTSAKLTRVGQQPTRTVLLAIRKQSGQNTVATVDRVREKLQDMKGTLPRNYTIQIIRDTSEYIRASTDTVKEHLVVGSILAALVVLVFLWNFRTTFISALAIPASIISTFGLMHYMNFTLNGLTLLALTLSVGIVIDDAIVVLENIYRYIEEKDMDPFQAAIEGTREIGPAVMATTLSLVAVFLPVAFLSGIVGRFLNSFGLTMAFAILVSLLVSFTLTPTMAARMLKKKKHLEGTVPPPDNVPVGVNDLAKGSDSNGKTSPTSKETGLYHYIDVGYTAILKYSMKNRWVIVLLSLVTLASIVPLAGAVPKNFLVDEDESQFEVSARTAEGTSLEATEAIADDIAAQIRTLPGVAYTVATVGNNTQRTQNLASIFVKLVDIEKRHGLPQQTVMTEARNKVTQRFPQLRTSVNRVQPFSTGAPPASVTYFISGPDLDKLTQYSENILKEFKKVAGAVDVDSSLIVGKPELGVEIDRRRAADLGVSVQDIAASLRLLVGGGKVTEYYQGGQQYEVHLRADKLYRTDPAVIGLLSVPSATLGSIPLNQVVRFKEGTGPSQISRMNRRRLVLIQSNVLPGYGQQEVAGELERIIKAQNMDPTYNSGITGNSRELFKAFFAFATAFLLALVFMYLILAAQFESWIHPLTILIALPLTLPFALLALFLFKQSLNIFSILGILVLFGVVKKNGILQVDHTNLLRAQGMNRYDAIITANRDRLRPILMTTFAFVVGMVPLVFSRGVGGGLNQTIGYAIIGGQTFSLLLTLLATPVFYSIFDDLQIGLKRVWKAFRNIGSRKRNQAKK